MSVVTQTTNENLVSTLEMVSMGIDQSLNGTGLCILSEGKPVVLETMDLSKEQGFKRVALVTKRVDDLVSAYHPDVINMEGYASTARSASVMPLAELGGCIKLTIFRHGYDDSRDSKLTGSHTFMVTNQSTMKKFMLGDGATQKDSAYLLKVFNKLNTQFEDDNQADAYMHACMAITVISILRRVMPFDTLPRYQQEALIGPGVRNKKGLSMNKAMKLSPEEKLALMGF